LEHHKNYWDGVARRTPVGQDYDDLLAQHYKQSHLDLILGWIDFSNKQTVLKTDLFAEARCPTRSFSWEILKLNDEFIGIDISSEISQEAKKTAAMFSLNQFSHWATCDVRSLPFRENSFDVIISDSTLDHYNQSSDIMVALKELFRTLKPGGTLCITMDNKTNLTEPLFRLWILTGLAPFYIGKTYSMRQLREAVEKTGLEVMDYCTLIHNPRFFTKVMISMLRRIFPKQCERWIKRRFDFFDSLGDKKTKYLTAQFIAVKAIKRANNSGQLFV